MGPARKRIEEAAISRLRADVLTALPHWRVFCPVFATGAGAASRVRYRHCVFLGPAGGPRHSPCFRGCPVVISGNENYWKAGKVAQARPLPQAIGT